MTHMRVPFKAFFLLCAVGLFIVGCDSPPTAGGVPRPYKLKTAVSLSPGTSEFQAMIGAQFVGRTAADDYPSSILPVPIVCQVKPDFERIAELKPSVILYDVDLYNAADVDKIKSMGAQVAVLDGYTIDDYIKSLYRLGQITASETNIVDYVDRVQKNLDVDRNDPLTPQPSAAVIMPAPNANPYVAGTGSFTADIVRTCGAKPVGPDSHKFESMSMEALLALNPDIIIIPIPPKSKEDPLANNPQLAALKAVKNHKVLEINEDYLLRRGSRVDTVLKDLHGALIKIYK